MAATLEARDKGGVVYLNGSTASMAPTLLPHDYFVGIPTPYSDLRIGMVCTYKASWNTLPSTCHRIVAKWAGGEGYVMEGDSDRNTAETQSVMNAANYQHHIISAYRFP